MSPARSLTVRIRECAPRDSCGADAPYAPRVGERWRLLVRLAPLSETRNFAGADPARFAFRDRVHLAGRVLPSRLNRRLALANASIDSAARARRRAHRRSGRRSGRRGAAGGACRGAHRSAERGSMARVQCDGHDAPRRHLRVAHHAVRVDCFLRRTPAVAMAAGAALGTLRRTRAFRRDARPRRRGSVFVAGRLLGARAAHLAHARLRGAGAARGAARGRGPHLGAGADRCPAARSLRAAVGGLLAVVRGGRRDSRGDQRGIVEERDDGGTRVERRAPAVRHHAGAGATHVRGVRWVVDRGAVGQSHRHSPGLVRARAAGAGRHAGGAGGAGLESDAVQRRGRACTISPGRDSCGLPTASSRCGVRRRRRGGSRSRRCRASCCLRRWPWTLRLSGRLRGASAAVRASRESRAGHCTRERLRRRTRFGCAGRSRIRTRCCSIPATAGTRAGLACGSSSCRSSTRWGAAPWTCWCCRRSTKTARRARRCWHSSASVRSVRVGGGWPATSLPVAPCTDSGFRMGRRGVSDLHERSRRTLLRAASVRGCARASC